MQVSKSTITALGDQHPLTQLSHIRDDRLLIFIQNFSAYRNAQNNIVAVLARAALPHARLAAFGEEVLLVAKVDQRVETIDRFDPDRAATAAIAPIWPTVFDEFFTSKAYSPAATAAGANIDFGKIEEFHVSAFYKFKGGLRPKFNLRK